MPCALPYGSCTVQGGQRDAGPVPKVREFPLCFKPRGNRLGQEYGTGTIDSSGDGMYAPCRGTGTSFPRGRGGRGILGRDLEKASPGIGGRSRASHILSAFTEIPGKGPQSSHVPVVLPDRPLHLFPPFCRRIRVSYLQPGGKRDPGRHRSEPGRCRHVFPILKTTESERATIPIPGSGCLRSPGISWISPGLRGTTSFSLAFESARTDRGTPRQPPSSGGEGRAGVSTASVGISFAQSSNLNFWQNFRIMGRKSLAPFGHPRGGVQLV